MSVLQTGLDLCFEKTLSVTNTFLASSQIETNRKKSTKKAAANHFGLQQPQQLKENSNSAKSRNLFLPAV